MRNILNILSILCLTLTLSSTDLYAQNKTAAIDTLYISDMYATFVIFSTDISFADISINRYVTAVRVDNQNNAIGIRAKEPFNTTGSFTAFESNGKIHSFIVKYCQHPESLIIDMRPTQSNDQYTPTDHVAAGVVPVVNTNTPSDIESRKSIQKRGRSGSYSITQFSNAPTLKDIYNKEPELYHLYTKEYGVTFLCTNLYSYSDITYITFMLENNSNISYDASTVSFAVTSKSKGKRSLDYDNPIIPKSSYGSLLTAPGGKSRICYSLDKLTLSKDQVLMIMLNENKGERNFCLTLSNKDINNAILPF